MQRLIMPFLLFGLLGSSQAPTEPVVKQTPESVLSKAVQSIGGRRALEKIESFKLHGVMRLGDER